MAELKKYKIIKVWERTNKNHYPDQEWVWNQIENSESTTLFNNAMEKKYALKEHGNTGNPGYRYHKNRYDELKKQKQIKNK